MTKRLKLGESNGIKLVIFGEERLKTIRIPTTNVDFFDTYMSFTVNVVPRIAGEIVCRPVKII